MKTVAFGERTYIGDPFNVIRLFNEKEVDEIVVLDIDATVDGRQPDAGFLKELATECFIPLAYGGGLRDVASCEPLAQVGIEKFVIGSAAGDANFLSALSRNFGAQAVVGCVDVRSPGGSAAAYSMSGRSALGINAQDQARRLQDLGCGEIIVQSIDRDGNRSGYDLELIKSVSAALSIPVIALGGAGTYEHLYEALRAGASAAASASAFCFIGRLRAVLINYPAPRDIEHFADCLRSAS